MGFVLPKNKQAAHFMGKLFLRGCFICDDAEYLMLLPPCPSSSSSNATCISRKESGQGTFSGGLVLSAATPLSCYSAVARSLERSPCFCALGAPGKYRFL